MKLHHLLLSACVAALNVAAQSDVIGVYLTWQRDPATTMTINWVNPYPHTPAKVFYRTGTNAPWNTATGAHWTLSPSTMQVRQVELTNLQPDTVYEFFLTELPPKEKELKELKGQRRFRTMPAELTRPVRFVSGGDMMHTREWVDAMNRRAATLEPDFAVIGGDLAYEDGTLATRWIDWLQSWTLHAKGTNDRCIPMVVGIGNHEVKGGYNGKVPQDAPYFFGLFRPGQEAHYALDFGRYLSFLMLDSGHTRTVPEQTNWLATALAERAGQRFLFPVYHYPAYGTAKAEANQLPCDLPRSKVIRANWVPLFERFGVSAVLEHDNHTFKRTRPLRGHQVDEANGVVYLGDGAWGVAPRDVPKNAWYLARAESVRHLYLITLEPSGGFQTQAIDVDGKLFDEAAFSRARTRPMQP